MNKIYITAFQPDPEGPNFGRVMDPDDFVKSQNYAHDHTTRITKALLVAGAEDAAVAGFAASLTDALGVSIAAGVVVDKDGVCYELDNAAAQILGAADPAQPRIDLIYATLAIDAEALTEFKPFQRLQTEVEIEAHADPYPIVQFDVPTELQTKATIHVRAGTPNGVPVAPALNAGEVPLWHVHVAAGQTVLNNGDLTDVRPIMTSLVQLVALVSTLDAAVIKKDGSVAFTANQSLGNHKITNLADATAATDAVNLQTLTAQISSFLSGLSWKTSVRAATTANIALTGTPTIDGVAVVTGDRVLVKNQTTASQNGIYVVAAGAWARAADADAWTELVSAVASVNEGTTQADTVWNFTVNAGGTMGTTAVTVQQLPIPTALATSVVDGLMSHVDKATFDAATAANTASTLMKRDSNGDVRMGKAKIDSSVEFESDNSSMIRAWPRESFIDLLDVSVPVDFLGAVDQVYETVKRTNASTHNGFNAQPEFDCFIDPADYVNVNFLFETYMIHGGTDVWDSTIQLYNANDGVDLAHNNYTWLETVFWKRSSVFTIAGSGLKRLVLRAKTHQPGSGGVAKIWRARLVINPST